MQKIISNIRNTSTKRNIQSEPTGLLGSLISFISFNTSNTLISAGQSLFEVIIAIGIAAMVLVGAVSLSTTSVRNSNFARNDSVATKFAQEGMEYARSMRDTDWASFSAQTGAVKNFGNLAWPPSGSCNIPSATTFCRTITLTAVSTVTVDVLIVVSWTDGQGTHTIRNATTFTRWH